MGVLSFHIDPICFIDSTLIETENSKLFFGYCEISPGNWKKRNPFVFRTTSILLAKMKGYYHFCLRYNRHVISIYHWPSTVTVSKKGERITRYTVHVRRISMIQLVIKVSQKKDSINRSLIPIKCYIFHHICPWSPI